MPAPTIPVYTGTVPNRNQAPNDFADNADDWLAYQAPLAMDYNNLATYLDALAITVEGYRDDASDSADEAAASASISSSNANFKGNWSDATGSATVPSSYFHNGTYWQLLVNVPDITATEPGTDSNWALARPEVIRYSVLDNPLVNLFKPNKVVEALSGTVSSSRAGAATYVDRYGTRLTAAIDELREEKGGYSIDGTSTNKIAFNRDVTQTGWSQTGTGTVSTDGTLASDNTTQMQLLDDTDTGNDAAFWEYVMTVSADSTEHTISVEVKAGTATECRLSIFLLGGTLVTNAIVFNPSTGVITDGVGKVSKKLANGAYRIEVSVANNGTNTALLHRLYPATEVAGVTGSTYATFHQTENLPFATSVINTSGSTATRVADLVTSNVYNNVPRLSEKWTMHVELDLLSTKAISPVRRILNVKDDNFFFQMSSEGFIQLGNLSTSLVVPFTSPELKYTATYDGTTLKVYIDGVFINSLVMSWVDITDGVISFGANPLGSFSAYLKIKDFRFYGKALNADEVKLLGD